MTKVLCAAIDCKYNRYYDTDGSVCKKEEINLSNHQMHTVHEGIQNLWRCKCYEKSDEAKRIEQMWKELLKDRELPTT